MLWTWPARRPMPPSDCSLPGLAPANGPCPRPAVGPRPRAGGVSVPAAGGVLGLGDAVGALGVSAGSEVTAACWLIGCGGSEVTGSASAAIAPATTTSDAVTAAPSTPAISPGLIDSRSATWRGTERDRGPHRGPAPVRVATDERARRVGVELLAGLLLDDPQHLGVRRRGPIEARRGNGVERVDDADDPRFQRDPLSRSARPGSRCRPSAHGASAPPPPAPGRPGTRPSCRLRRRAASSARTRRR